MKISTNFSHNKTSRLLMLIGMTAGALLFNSCKKEDATVTVANGIALINASPTPATYNVYLNTDTRLNSAALPFGGTVSYRTIASGSNTLKFTSASSIESLLTKTVTVSDNSAYSYFLIGSTTSTLDGLLVNDDLSATSSDKAFVRFINLSPDAGSLDLAVTGATTNLISDKTYKTASSFVQVDPKTYSFDIKDKATGAVKTTLTGVVFAAGYHYTVFAKGMNTPTSQQIGFGGQTMTNQ
ncbi:DUF4397 domain-containing protein [Pedobacter duraquae]|uniref:Uncharacterized protein DUF4397 n=1 Tax=Pedobacter duraquae TaxID=425511 RepID=A0A4R6INZ3_9SPHI|nr:DUF4397 domain-containing protein [Pedobacter duraquae]TDO23994.1 uncharacterized protein DUF4397 [Pedobacter duraquae]